MGFQEDFQAALNQLVGSGDAQSPSSYRKMDLNPVARPSAPFDLSSTFTPSALDITPAAHAQTNNQPWWRNALNALNGVGSVLPNQIADWTDGKMDRHDIPLYDFGKDYLNGAFVKPFQEDGILAGLAQMNPFSVTWNGLKEAGAHAKDTSDVLDNLGWQADPNKPWYNPNNLGHAAVGFLGDVALDPTTYVTLGAGSAVKAGAKAIAKEAAEQAAKHGVESVAKGGVESVAKKTADAVFENEMRKTLGTLKITQKESGISRELAERAARQKADAAFNAITNAGKSARNTAQNALVNLDVPFTKITKQFGEKPDFLKIKDAQIGAAGAAVVAEKLANLGLTDEQRAGLISKAYKVSDPAHMTSQMLDHFNETIGKVAKAPDLPNENVVETINKYFTNVSPTELNYSRFNPDEFLNGRSDYIKNKLQPDLKKVNTQTDIPLSAGQKIFGDIGHLRNTVSEDLLNAAPKARKVNRSDLAQAGNDLKNVEHTAEFTKPKDLGVVYDTTRKVDFKPSSSNANTVKRADKTFDANKFAQDMGGKSKIGKIVSDKWLKSINARSLGATDQFVNQAAGHIRDAEGMIRGNTAQMARDVKRIDSMAKGLTDADLEKIPYFLENKAPGKQSMEDFLKNVSNREQFNKVAGEMKSLFDRFAKEEKGVGALGKSIQDYFPHVIQKSKLSSDELEKLMQDPEISKLMGRSAKNNFDQQRKGFRTFADWKDAIEGIKSKMSSMPDGEAKDKLASKLEHIDSVFEENSVKAMTARYQKHVRTTAMTQLYKTFRNNGMLVSRNSKRGGFIGDKTNFTRIDEDLAKKLGLKKADIGGSIHNDVLKGLERVDSLFTDAGMNKFLDTMTSVTNIWKTLVTSYIPSHHYYNLVGNIANNTLAGVKPGAYKKSAQLIKKMRQGKLDDTEKKFVQEAYDKGILAAGNMVDVHDPLRIARTQGKGTLGKVENFMSNNKYAEGARWVGDNVDDFSRLAHYIQIRKDTGSAKLAADSVRKYLFNYGELTNVDKGIKIVAPFWTWTKNNLPRQLQEFARQPRYYQTYINAQEAIQGKRDTSLAPDYTVDSFLTGSDKKKQTFYNPRLPLADLTNVGSVGKTFDTAMNMLNPLIKDPIELKMNKQFFNNAPIDPSKTDNGDYHPDAIAQYLTKQSGVGNKVVDIFDKNADILDTIRNSFIGKPMEIDLAKQRQRAYYEKRDEKLAEKKKRAKSQSGGN